MLQILAFNLEQEGKLTDANRLLFGTDDGPVVKYTRKIYNTRHKNMNIHTQHNTIKET